MLAKGALKMEKEKKLKIAVIVLSIIAILEFLIIIGGNNTTVETNGDTNVEYVEPNSNENVSTNTSKSTNKKLTDDEIKANIQVEYAGISANGDFVLKVTNNNDKTVIIDGIDTIFKDEKNVFAEKAQIQDRYFGIQAHKTIYVYDWGFEKDFSKYPNYEFSVNLANSSYILESTTVDNFEITANNSGEQIAVEIKNNNDFSVEDVRINTVYYKDDKIIGIQSGTDIMSNATPSQGTTYINVEYPEDSNYSEVSFDNYEVYLISADIVK